MASSMGSFENCQFSGFPDGGISIAEGATVDVYGKLVVSHNGGNGIDVGQSLYSIKKRGVYGMVMYDFSIRNNKLATIEDLMWMQGLLKLPDLTMLREDLTPMLDAVEQELIKPSPDANHIESIILAVNNFIEKHAGSLAQSIVFLQLQKIAQVRRIIAPKGRYT